MKVLQQIKDSGLEKTIETEALSLAEKNLTIILKDEEESCGCGTIYINLLDDERLPLVGTDLPEIDDECPPN